MPAKKPETFEQYAAGFPVEVQMKMKQLYEIIIEADNKAEPCISYGMPAFKHKGKPLAYFAAFKNHVGLYPTSTPIKAFESDLGKFNYSKGAIQFPHESKLPVTLIRRIIKFKAREIDNNLSKK